MATSAQQIQARQDQALWQLGEDFVSVAGSVVCPIATPTWQLGRSAWRLAHSEKSIDNFIQESPNLAFGFLNLLPSVATGSFVAPIIFKSLGMGNVANHVMRASSALMLTRPFGMAFRLMSHPLVSVLFLGSALAGGLMAIYQNYQKYSEDEITGLTLASSILSASLLLFPTFAFNAFSGTPRHTVEALSLKGEGEIRLRFHRPRKLTLDHGGKLNFGVTVALGMRRLMFYTAPRCLWAYRPKARAVRIAIQERMEMEKTVLYLAGVEEFTVCGSRHLAAATDQVKKNGALVETVQLVHDRLTNFVEVPLAAELSGKLQRLMMKPSLSEMELLSLVAGARVGHQANFNVPKDPEGTAANLLAGLGVYHDQGVEEAQGVFAALVRTMGRNLATKRIGIKYVRTPGGIVRHENVQMGPDQPNVVYLPYSGPFAAALAASKSLGKETLLVPSILTTGMRDEKTRSVRVEYYEPISTKNWMPANDSAEALNVAAHRLRDHFADRLVRDWFPKNPDLQAVRLVTYPVPKRRETVIDLRASEGAS